MMLREIMVKLVHFSLLQSWKQVLLEFLVEVTVVKTKWTTMDFHVFLGLVGGFYTSYLAGFGAWNVMINESD